MWYRTNFGESMERTLKGQDIARGLNPFAPALPLQAVIKAAQRDLDVNNASCPRSLIGSKNHALTLSVAESFITNIRCNSSTRKGYPLCFPKPPCKSKKGNKRQVLENKEFSQRNRSPLPPLLPASGCSCLSDIIPYLLLELKLLATVVGGIRAGRVVVLGNNINQRKEDFFLR